MLFEHQPKSLTLYQNIVFYNIPLNVSAYSDIIGLSCQVKRKKHKSNATSFQLVEGGAVPTFTHQRLEKD